MVDTISFVLSESIEDYVVTIPEQYIASGICGGAKKKYQRLKYTYKTPDRLRSYSIEIIGEGTDKVYFIVPNSDNTYGGHIFYSSFGWGLDDQSKGSTHNLVTGDFYKCWDFTAEAKWQSTPNYPQYSYTGYVDYEASESNASYNFTHGVVVFSLYENSDSMELYELIP